MRMMSPIPLHVMSLSASLEKSSAAPARLLQNFPIHCLGSLAGVIFMMFLSNWQLVDHGMMILMLFSNSYT